MSPLARRNWSLSILFLFSVSSSLFAQTEKPPTSVTTPPEVKEPTHADLLRGSYGPYRANNDLLFYHLDLRVDPEKKFISGSNEIRFKMLEDGTRIQLELFPSLQIDSVEMGKDRLKYERDGGTFFVDF